MTTLQTTFYGFVVFDKCKNIQYSQYNFNFDSYSYNFGLIGQSKNTIFQDFLQRNNFDYAQPYSVIPDLVQYFTPITKKIIKYIYHYCFAMHFGF